MNLKIQVLEGGIADLINTHQIDLVVNPTSDVNKDPYLLSGIKLVKEAGEGLIEELIDSKEDLTLTTSLQLKDKHVQFILNPMIPSCKEKSKDEIESILSSYYKRTLIKAETLFLASLKLVNIIK